MDGRKFLNDFNKVQKSHGDNWLVLYRKGVCVGAIYCDDNNYIRIEHKSRGVYLICSGCLRIVVDEYMVYSY